MANVVSLVSFLLLTFDFGYFPYDRSREDAVFALHLAHTISEQNGNSTVTVNLELYHYSVLSPFLTAKLESHKGVQVIDIKNPYSTSCFVDALTVTRLADVVLAEPSIVLISQPTMPKKKNTFRIPSGTKILCDGTSAGFGSVTSTSLELDDNLKVYAKLQRSCKFQRAYSYQSSIDEGALAKRRIFFKDSSDILKWSNVGAIHVSGRFSHIFFLTYINFCIRISQSEQHRLGLRP